MVRLLLSVGVLLTACVSPALAADHASDAKLDRELRGRALAPRGHSRVIVRLAPGVSGDALIRGVRGTAGRRLLSVGGQVADVPDSALDALARLPGVSGVSLDRRVRGTLERTGATIGATFVQQTLGFDGTGVGIAVVDSGVTSWHDDLGSTRVARFVDFVGFQPAAYDDYGHGTHVAGILAGSGYDSGGRRRGIAPGATLLVEKVLDAGGQGYISNVIAAIDYAIANKDALHLRIINLSVAAGVYESYNTDPLTLAAKRAVEAGLVVVSAAGNLGRAADGSAQYGGIGAPGNAPWVLTVGASSHNGTADRSDDTVAPFSSRGPSSIDFQAKPDLVAPGVGIESLAEAGSTLYNTKPLMRLWGTVQTATEPYLSLSGTSMASPVVSGTIALMLQANPDLTPNQVKAILQITAERRDGYDALTEGAGFLNARGAVEAAQATAAGASLETHADPTLWSGQVIWGNHLLAGSAVTALGEAGAWRADVTWGASSVIDAAADGEGGRALPGSNIVWGSACGGADCVGVVWGAACDDEGCDTGMWGTADDGLAIAWDTNGDRSGDDIVWGTADAVEDTLWSAPAIRRPRRVVTVMDAALR
jgi:serine protease AprX